MSTIIRMAIGIGLFAFGFQLGRAVGRMEPLTEELRGAKGRRGIVIDGEKEDVEPNEEVRQSTMHSR